MLRWYFERTSSQPQPWPPQAPGRSAANSPRTVPELFEVQAARTPEALAIVSDDQSLTYGELNSRANRLAHYLRVQAIGPEAIVGIALERSIEMVVAV